MGHDKRLPVSVNLDQGGCARGRAKILPPPPDLAAIVESSFILNDGASPDHVRATWRLVPDPSANIIVVLPAFGARAEAAVVGARSTFEDIDASKRQLTVGIRLRPGALSAIAREKATSFTDQGFSVEDVLGGSEWRSLCARLDDKSDPNAVLGDVFELLRRRMAAATTKSAAHSSASLKVIAAATQAASVAEMAHALAMPVRTLNLRSHETIGLSPKRLLRILRLYRALEMVRPGSIGWASVAASAGFADQPHLVREVRELLGETPREWMARAAA